jgi:CheY-like chemotaxis protein
MNQQGGMMGKEITKILLVEDEPYISLIIRKSLSARPNLEIVCVGNGREAVEAYQREKFDIILMDLVLPEMDGIEATEKIRSLERGNGKGAIPIISISVRASAESIRQCLEAGMSEFISKPFKMSFLISRIEAICNSGEK